MRSIPFRLAALRDGALPGPFLFLICYANALHSIPLGGPPGPRSRSKHSLAPICCTGFWTSTFENGYPVAYDVIADKTNDGIVSFGHMELVTGKGGEYARHIRAVWDPNM